MTPAYTARVQPSPTPEGPRMGLLQILPVGRFPSAPGPSCQQKRHRFCRPLLGLDSRGS